MGSSISGNDKTIYYLISMLKAYGIKNIVASPGMQNSKFNAVVQEDDFFSCYSVVDERSAAYFATGISYETTQSVVITCTGATASRNYLSALTEAYYRKIPIIAITFYNSAHNDFNLSPQYVDRKSIQNDISYISVNLPKISEASDKEMVLTMLNVALFEAVYKNCPVHINCPSSFIYDDVFKVKLPTDIWTTKYYEDEFSELKSELCDKRFAVFVGAHHKFKEKEQCALSEFAKSYDIPVLCDHTSNYHGVNKVLISQFVSRIERTDFPELMIDIGEICGEYAFYGLFEKSKLWRISEDGVFKCRRSKPVENFFNCKESYFFELLKSNNTVRDGYYSSIKANLGCELELDLPLSNVFVCSQLAKYIPNNSSLHLAILNSLRSMNYFNLDESIDVNCNVGGFGIDGPVSTIIGQSVANPDKKCFGVIGDLAFFYDMNALGLRHLGDNLRLIIINNNRGEEFRLNQLLEKSLCNKTDKLIAAAGHYKKGVEDWAKSCGFTYLKATTKDEFSAQIESFCSKDYKAPVLFEVFTTNEDEQLGLRRIKKKPTKNVIKNVIKVLKNVVKR